MPKIVNTSTFSNEIAHESGLETMIKVENVSMIFNLASEQLNSLKEYAIKIARRELFFEGFTALDDVSFEVKKGDVFGIVGTNGSGKSTLMKIIAGVLDPSKGSCEVKGRIAPLIELGAGFDLELTARENIYLNGALLGYSKAYIEEHFDEIVAFAEIEKFIDMPMKNYSSGMVARIAFAIATVIIPDVLIVDEVLSVGDFMFQKKCEDRITELIETHEVTVLIVSHSNDQIERLCNKVIWVEKGHTRMMGDAEKVCRTYRALGGRTGDAASEMRVFEALKTEKEIPEESCLAIERDDSFGVAAHAASLIWKDRPMEAAIITCGLSHINTIVANGLAGALDAPLLHTKTDHLPDSVDSLLYRFQPQQIFFVDCGRNAQKALEYLKMLDWNPEIIDFSNNGDVFELSNTIFEYGKARNIWGQTAVVVDFVDNAESLASAPFVYKGHYPVFSSSDYDKMNSSSIVDLIKSNDFDRVIIFGNNADEAIVEQCHEAGIDVSRIAAKETYRSCLDICEWILQSAEMSEGAKTRELGVASLSLSQWPDALMAGAYCAHRNTALLMQDTTNLDSVAACLDFVAQKKGSMDRLVFFGGDSSFGDLERDLLCQELL